MAGLWERWDKGEEPIESCTILTTDANELMQPIHDRMPVIISPEQYDLWLDSRCQDVTKVVRPYSTDDMLAYPISTLVNNWKNDTAKCIEPVATLF